MLVCMVQASKIFWQQTIEGQTVEFDNTPFVVSEIRKLDYQFGKHYFKPKQSVGSSHVHLQGTRKIGCKAHVVVHTITVFSDYHLSQDVWDLEN